MSLSEFLQEGWRVHESESEDLLARFPAGVALLAGSDDIPKLAGLITHVAGEHLGRWDEGLALLDSIAASPHHEADSPAGRSLQRAMAVLHHCAGRLDEAAVCEERGRTGGDVPAASDRIRILASAAPALAGQERWDDALSAFHEAVELAEYGPGAEDPAARALAILGNNLACALEERSERNEAEDAALRAAAETARRYWEQAGTWVNVERAEYRLAMSHLSLGDPDAALEHAENCLAICVENEADAGELFFACEALAKAHHALAWTARSHAAGQLESLEGGMRSFCEEELEKLDLLLGH